MVTWVETDVRNRDPKGHYGALNIGPGASQQEIRLAYKFLKRAYREGRRSLDLPRIQQAYEILSSPTQRKLYDEGRSSARRRRAGQSRIHSMPLLLTTLLAFLATIGFMFGSAIRAHFVTFDVGDALYWKNTEKPLGVVLEHDPDHRFPGGNETRAYRIQLGEGQEAVWLPALDLNRNCAVGVGSSSHRTATGNGASDG